MKYFFLISLLAAFNVQAQGVGSSVGVPPSTAPQGAGTTLQTTPPGASPSTIGAGNFESPASSVNFGTTPANTNTTLGDGVTPNPNLNQPGTIPNDTTFLNTPSNNPIPQAQEDPLNFSTLPDTTTPASGTGTNPASPVDPFPATGP